MFQRNSIQSHFSWTLIMLMYSIWISLTQTVRAQWRGSLCPNIIDLNKISDWFIHSAANCVLKKCQCYSDQIVQSDSSPISNPNCFSVQKLAAQLIKHDNIVNTVYRISTYNNNISIFIIFQLRNTQMFW